MKVNNLLFFLFTLFNLIFVWRSLGFSEQYIHPESEIHSIRNFLKQKWDKDKKRYTFHHEIIKGNSDLKLYPDYFEVYYGEGQKILFSKRWVNQKLQAQFFFVDGLISHYIFFLEGDKHKTIFFNKRQIKVKAYYYDALSKNISKKVFFRKNGIDILKKEIYDHKLLREEYIYYPNNKLKSHTEYFEGKKKYYNEDGKVIKTERFKPRKIYQKKKY